MQLTTPPALHPTDRIWVVSPSSPVDPDAFRRGIECFPSSHKAVWNESCLARQGFLAGSDETRLMELQAAFDAPDCKAIIASRGGYGVSRIVDALDLSALAASPKWVVGSSDLTALLLHLWRRLRIKTVHGPMVARFSESDEADLKCLFDLFQGGPWSPPSGLTPAAAT